MISFPNAKINIGLNVLERRTDGYHTIESIFYPVKWCDAIEIIPEQGNGIIHISALGIPIPGSPESNLCVKAYNLLSAKYKLPSLHLYLLKCIPLGAGLGGGSADAAFFLKLINDVFQLNTGVDELKLYAAQIGSDCTFFIENKPALVTGTGNIVHPINLDLSKHHIAIIYPQIHVDTKNAYSLIRPHRRNTSLTDLIQTPIHTWKETIINDFEEPIFKANPSLAELKNLLYQQGALYASMTGSGSALYGIFDKKPHLEGLPSTYKIWINSPA